MIDIVGPYSELRVCGTNSSPFVSCSDYSFVHFVYTYTPASLASNIFAVSSGNTVLRVYIPIDSTGLSFSGSDFYVPIPSNSSYFGFTFSNTLSGTFSYELLTSVSSGPSTTPSGSISIIENGTYDVSSYAEAVVDVPPIPGDYHDDLISIRNGIFIFAGVLLVLYL